MNNCISKTELARKMGVSPGTVRNYLDAIADKLPHYNRYQKILTPDQHTVFREHYCVE